jgi:hypothetical protein
MSHWIRSLFRKFAPPEDAVSPTPADEVELSIEELEARRLPAADITSLLAAGGSASTNDPVVAGSVEGDPIVGIEFEFDRNSDGTFDGTGYLEHESGGFTFDLREVDSTLDDFDGAMTVRARAIELDGQGAPVAGEWVSTDFFVFGPPPTLNDFTVAETGDDEWTISGSVAGARAAGATIEFGGVLNGQTVTADSAGNFSLSVTLGEIDGMATAKVVDSLGQESETAEAYCCSIPDPVVTDFSGSEGDDDVWTFSGTVSGPLAANATVTFGGVLAGHSVQADSNGYFSATIELGNVDGVATAQAADGDGRVSDAAEFYCCSEPDPASPEPWLITFSGTEGANDVWTFTGTIGGVGCEGATVTFGGVLAGYSTQVGANGEFSLTQCLGNVDGYASAQVVDPTNQTVEAETYCCSEPDPPEPWEITSFSATEGENDVWTFTGTISGVGCEGATVTFGGVLAGYSAQVDSSGNFSLMQGMGDINGYASAQVVDPTNQTVEAEIYCLSEPDPEPEPLVISSFSGAMQEYEGEECLWWFSGTVTGPNAAWATVSFGGVLGGATAQTDSAGSFFLSLLIPGVSGAATAVAANGGAPSAMVEYYVQV